MANDIVANIVSRAVGTAYDVWASSHPTLAGVIDRMQIQDQAAVSLRDSDAYRSAVAAYYRSRSELELLTQLIELAGPIVAAAIGR